MKLKTKTPAILLMVIIVAFACITCVNQDIKELGTEANLISLRIESGSITDIASKVALPIPASIMDKEDLTSEDLYGSDYDQPDTTIGWADIRVRDKDTGKITGRIRPELSRGARAQWGIATRTTRPDAFYDTRVPATLDSDEYIYIRVESEDGLEVSYYRFYAKLLSWATNLQYIDINKRRGTAGASVDGVSTGGSSWDKVSKVCELSIALKEGQGAIVIPTTFDPNATVKYAVVKGEGAPGTFTPSDQPVNIDDQDFLYIEVTAENTIDKEYFKFKVSVGRMASIFSFKVSDGANDDIDIYGLGLPQPEWEKVGIGEYQTADQPADGFIIKLVPDDPDATVVYERIADDTAQEPDTYNNNNKIRFTNPQSLAVKVTSAKDLDTLYYKVRITNLAANITRHPKAAWYYREDIRDAGVSEEGKRPVAPLTVELDRPAQGPLPYEYQWYESDSWYGIYGRHGTSRDEKNNITTVNGGPGQYFRLVQPDEPPITLKPDGYTDADFAKSPGAWRNWPGSDDYYWADYTRGGEPMAWTLVGETSSSYTPRTDWIDNTEDMEANNEFYTNTQNNSFPIPPIPPRVNFLSGSTNESRYYWVKVYDPNTGLSVVSERALIITETDPNMDHFIFDLSSLPKKNVTPFTKEGTAESNVYKIDLKNYPFPADFEKKLPDYQICIAHAQYFLPDGRSWTQNWTHGNLHFGTDAGYQDLEWWHNNMGANGGSIPLQAPHSSQGGLGKKPDWIGFTPSGDPAKGLPPPINAAGDLPKGIYSMDAKEKYPAGVAQGYFAAFIELLEVRFQTRPEE